jgi:hypothetical protein
MKDKIKDPRQLNNFTKEITNPYYDEINDDLCNSNDSNNSSNANFDFVSLLSSKDTIFYINFHLLFLM